MKTRILLPILLLASFFLVKCKKANDVQPLPAFINQVYYVGFTLNADVYAPSSFTFQKDGKLKLVIPSNDDPYNEFTGTYKVNGTNIEISYSLGQKDTTYTITANFSNDYKTFNKGIVMLVKNGSSTEFGSCGGAISLLIPSGYEGSYNYKNNTTAFPIKFRTTFKEDNTIDVKLSFIDDDYNNPIICKGTYQLTNGILSGSFKDAENTISISFESAIITSDGKNGNYIKIPNNKLKVVINDQITVGTTTDDYFLIRYTTG